MHQGEGKHTQAEPTACAKALSGGITTRPTTEKTENGDKPVV